MGLRKACAKRDSRALRSIAPPRGGKVRRLTMIEERERTSGARNENPGSKPLPVGGAIVSRALTNLEA